MKTAIFPGSFNPFTIGHKSIVDRFLPLFDRIVVAIGFNSSKPTDDSESRERIDAIRRIYGEHPKVKVVAYSCLTVDLAREWDAQYIIRGIRDVADFEYERKIADINRSISGIETIFMLSLPEHTALSSSIVRELKKYGHDISPFIPKE